MTQNLDDEILVWDEENPDRNPDRNPYLNFSLDEIKEKFMFSPQDDWFIFLDDSEIGEILSPTVQEGTPVNFSPRKSECPCKCRHLMRELRDVLEELGFTSKSRDILNPEREPESSKHKVLERELGEPCDWYYRKMYLMIEFDDDGEPVDGETTFDGISCAFTEDEAARLFHELKNCNCCARHLSNRPETPQSWVCSPCSSLSEEKV